MVQGSYKASAPGSMMLLGEHAVLQHNAAIVCAIDKKITINLYPINEERITINDDFVTTISGFNINNQYSYVLGVISTFLHQLPSGFRLEIISNCDPHVGFGSSAAVTVAMVAVMVKWLGFSCEQRDIFFQAKKIMLQVQNGLGSGADLAASTYGGVVYYISEPMYVEQLPIIPYIYAVYSGSKLKTPEVVAKVLENKQQFPELYTHILQGINSCVQKGKLAIKAQDWPLLGKIFNIQHGLLAGLGVSNTVLDEIVWMFRNFGALGAKISGSGLGDCVVGVGKLGNDLPITVSQKDKGVLQLPVTIVEEGVKVSKNC